MSLFKCPGREGLYWGNGEPMMVTKDGGFCMQGVKLKYWAETLLKKKCLQKVAAPPLECVHCVRWQRRAHTAMLQHNGCGPLVHYLLCHRKPPSLHMCAYMCAYECSLGAKWPPLHCKCSQMSPAEKGACRHRSGPALWPQHTSLSLKYKTWYTEFWTFSTSLSFSELM